MDIVRESFYYAICIAKIRPKLQPTDESNQKMSQNMIKVHNKLGLSWAKLSSSWDWALLQL